MDHYNRKNFTVTQSMGFMLSKSRNLVAADMDTALKDLGVTSQQMGIFLSLARGLARTPFELSKLLAIDSGLMTRMLDKLESQDLLTRNRSDEDRRVFHLELTDEGHAIAEKISDIAPQVLNRRLRRFSKTEFTELKRLLTKFIGESQDGEPT
ncbi:MULTISPECIES: MarR family transcriptional regulator [unclassified Dyella]|uniref:MarR family winged helix-turn-helix transcriptional regulator n=1 Tax=unclassified Dyella TaxID=2634549 RepID=UPI000C81844E|nr:MULTISPECIES: MarR family transcriptional regulator [unclassified Dyella]MDR3446370.1 MarR family transcriptional regulator [Dyella sp.]PMQ04468.1 Multiple antibiotic resistance protein MarR [Dyella sp. AD56]